jgi:malonyl-CoA O-methyltransferase
MAAHPMFSKSQVAQSFGLAACDYDHFARLQQYVGYELLKMAPPLSMDDAVIIDVGAGTGFFSVELQRRYPNSHALALDLSEGMMRVASERVATVPIVGDAESLPIRSSTVDLVFSSLAIQWCNSTLTAFNEFYRVLGPKGYLLFSTLGAQTLNELRKAWSEVDSHSHVNDFMSFDDVLISLEHANFEVLEFRRELISSRYSDVMSLMKELKGLGAHNLTQDRPRQLMSKRSIKKMLLAYPKSRPEAQEEYVEASFEVIVGLARAGVR